MADIDTLLDFARHLRGWDETKVVDGEETTVHHDGVYEVEKAQAQQDFTDKVHALAGAREMVGGVLVETPGAIKHHQTLIDEFAILERQLRTLREQIGQVLMPADRQALVDRERELRLQLRKKRAEILVSEAALQTLESEKEIAKAELKRSESALKQADGMLRQAEQREQRHNEWKQAIAVDGTLDQLKARAQDRLDEREAVIPEGEEVPLIQQAKLRVENDIPAALRTRARERARQVDDELVGQMTRIDTLQGDQATHRASTQDISGRVAQRRWSFEKAEAGLQDLVQQGPVRYHQALALLKRVVDSKPLTEEERNRISEVAIGDPEPNALSEEKKLDLARAAVADAEAAVRIKTLEVELARIQALTNNPELDPEEDAQVISKKTELTEAVTTLSDAQTVLTNAETDYTDAMAEALDVWEAAIPDHIWANLVAYDDAVNLLTRIRDSDPAVLASNMDNAEVALVDALELEQRNQQVIGELGSRLLLLEAQLETLRNAHHPRKLSAVRGDA